MQSLAMKDIFDDLALLEYPPLSAGGDDDQLEAAEQDLDQFRSQQVRQMEVAWDEGERILYWESLRRCAAAQLAAERHMRLLLAYAREFVGPRRTHWRPWPRLLACRSRVCAPPTTRTRSPRSRRSPARGGVSR